MEEYVRFELLGYHWTVKPEYAPVIKEHAIPAVLCGGGSPQLKVVKRKHARSSFIFSVDDASPAIFAKIHKYEKPRERLKSLFRASRAKAEWTMGEQMLASGLPVPESLGYGEKRAGGVIRGCVLFQLALGESERLSKCIAERYASPDGGSGAGSLANRNALLKSLGELIRRMHLAGFWHPDLHTGNVLVDSRMDLPKFWIVDLHSVGRSAHLSDRRRMADLAKTIFSLSDYVDESSLEELVRGYAPEAGEAELNEMFSKLLARVAGLRRLRLRSRAKRCLKTSGKFVVEKVGNKKLYRNRAVEMETVLSAVNHHKEVRATQGPEFVKSTPKSVLTSFPLADKCGETVYVKEFSNRGVIRLLETAFYMHRGRRAWRAGHRLRLLGVPCAEPIALVEERRIGLLHTSYVLMKEIPDATRLNLFLMKNYFRFSERLTPEEILKKRRLIRAGAAALKEFHAKKVYHKDLSAKNLLVGIGQNGRPLFYCVDSDSVSFPLRLSLRRRIKNLAQLNGLPGCITTADKIRFYKDYMGIDRLTPKHRALLWFIRGLSRERMEHCRRIDARLKRNYPLKQKSYEDIASL
jgi:tRNA A-37 threonylcarbamoyl transferase component Bud32